MQGACTDGEFHMTCSSWIQVKILQVLTYRTSLIIKSHLFHFVIKNKINNKDYNFLSVLFSQIISGVQIPKPNDSKKGEVIDPFIKIEVHGAPSDNAEYSSKVVTNNGK